MALIEYLGSIILEVDGVEAEVESLDVETNTGRKLVKTMNKTGRAKGFAKGIAEYALRLTVVIPLTGDIDWAAIQGAKLTQYPLATGGKRVSYLDCFTLTVGEKYTVDSEAKRDLTMQSLRRVEE
ncbi:MAG TPA: phage tail protein [Methylophilaceae bacterium]|nr:phage tail protein [Methylophilaceae bacterium]